MAGHMGAEQVTTQSLEVVRVDEENNVLLIKGAVPGAKGETVVVKPSIKARAKAEVDLEPEYFRARCRSHR